MVFDQGNIETQIDTMTSIVSLGQSLLPVGLSSTAVPESFDFDTWVALAKVNPAAFEEARAMMLEKAIAKAEKKDELQCLQWRIDGVRYRAKTPLKACLCLSEMMWDSFSDMRSALSLFTSFCEGNHPVIRLVVSSKGHTPSGIKITHGE